MSLRTTGILALLALALGAYVYLVEVRGVREEAEAEEAAKRVLDLDADSVTALELPLGEEGGTARLERNAAEKESWRLVAPIEYPADAGVVSGIVSTLTELSSESIIDDPPEDLSAFGLSGEAPSVRISRSEGDPLTLRLGDKAPLGSARYLQVQGDPRLFTVAEWRTTSLRPELRSLRDKRITEPAPEDVASLRVVERGTLLAHVRRSQTIPSEGTEEDGEWRIIEPISDEADGRRIRRLIDDLHFLRATEFIDEPGGEEEYGLDAPEIVLELEAGEERRQLEFGRKLGKVYLRSGRRAPVFQVPERSLADIPRELFAYRTKKVIALEEDKAERIELRFPRDDVSYAFVRREKRWVPEDESIRVESLRVEDVLYAVRDLEATGLEERSIDPKQLGLDPPGVRVTVLEDDGSVLGWLELGDAGIGEGIAARSSQNDRLWRVAQVIGEDVPLTLEAFRNHFLTEPPPAPEQDVEGEDGTPETPEGEESE